jgi:hypothetical protein
MDLVAALKCQFPRQVHLLLGNHELAQWTGQWITKADVELTAWFRQGVDTAYGPRAAEVYAAYCDLFAHIPLAVKTPNRVFLSHSSPGRSRLATFDPAVLEQDEAAPKDLQLGGTVHALVWGRDTRSETVAAFLDKVDADLLITGHIPCPDGFEVPNGRQLILESMAAPAAYCLFAAARPLSHQDLRESVHEL